MTVADPTIERRPPVDTRPALELAARLRGMWQLNRDTPSDVLEAACTLESQAALIATFQAALDTIDDLMDTVDTQVAGLRRAADQLSARQVSLLAENAALVLASAALPAGHRPHGG